MQPFETLTWKLTYKTYRVQNGRKSLKVKIKFIDADSAVKAKELLDIHPSLILKCEIYKPKNHD
jgi:hypothetical protein